MNNECPIKIGAVYYFLDERRQIVTKDCVTETRLYLPSKDWANPIYHVRFKKLKKAISHTFFNDFELQYGQHLQFKKSPKTYYVFFSELKAQEFLVNEILPSALKELEWKVQQVKREFEDIFTKTENTEKNIIKQKEILQKLQDNGR